MVEVMNFSERSFLSNSVNDLEREAIQVLSSKFRIVRKKKKITGNPSNLETFNRRQKRWGKIILANTFELGKVELLPSLKNIFIVNSFGSSLNMSPSVLWLPNGCNLYAWIMAHLVFRSEFQDHDTPAVLKNHTSSTSITTSAYWSYRVYTLSRKGVVFAKKDEEKLMSSYAIYTKADETYLNSAFPEAAPFPSCHENFEMYTRVDFFKDIVYPIYSAMIKRSASILIFRKKLKSQQNIYITQEFFPTVKKLKETYPLLFHASPKSEEKFLIVNASSIAKANHYLHDVDALFVFFFAAVILEINKDWF